MPSNKRNPPRVVTPRDYEMIRLCALLGVMTSVLFSILLFTPALVTDQRTLELHLQTQANCLRRLLFLTTLGYLDRLEQPSKRSEGPKNYLYIPTKKGIRALAENLGKDERYIPWRKIDKNRSPQFYAHLLALNSVRVAFAYGVARFSPDSSVEEWRDDAQLKRIHSQRDHRMSWQWPNGKQEKNTALIPDGYIHIILATQDENGETYFEDYFLFIECDMSTEPGMSNIEERHSWERKIRQYIELFKEDGLYQKYYQEDRIGRVFTITSGGEKRLANLKAVTEKAGGKHRFMFTTMEKIEKTMQRSLLAEAHLRKAKRTAKANGYPVCFLPIPTILTEPIWYKAGKEELFKFVLD